MDIIKNIKYELNQSIDKFDMNQMECIKNIIKEQKKNIFITGIGKCETIAQHFANLLKSISYKAFHISIQNSSHGDIGCIHEDDLIILFSKSGNTKEIIDFLRIIELKENIKILSISCNNDAKMYKFSNYYYTIPLENEINIGIDNIPNNSCVMMMIFINIITKMVENIELSKYKINHLGGSIGNNLKSVEEVMIKDYPKLILINHLKLIDIVLEMTKKKIGLAIINDKNENIIGIISDGDIRRLLLKDKDLNNIEMEDINTDYFKINDINICFQEIKGLLLKYKFIPIVNNDKCIGLLHENIVKNIFY